MTPQEQWVQHKEKALAWIRVVFAFVALAVVQLNPARVARYPVLSECLLFSFLVYSLFILYFAKHRSLATLRIGIITTYLDLLWISGIVLSTGGTRTPFFTYYFFPVITASSRWGIRGSVAVALIGDTLYWIVRYTVAVEGLEGTLGMDTFVVRSIYLVVIAYIFGFLSEFEKKQNQKLVALSNTAAEVAMMEERRRIARELHDGLLQTLATHLLRIETCRNHFIGSPSDLERELRAIENDTRDSMRLIRRFLSHKETQTFPPGMLFDYLKGDLEFLRDGLGMRVSLETEPEELNIPESVEQELYFILREALMNISKHSQASTVEITVSLSDGKLYGAVRDDGLGFNPRRSADNDRHGLKNMRERVTTLSGELGIESSPGRGTTVRFVLPVRQAAAA
ncbi:MAG TPA: sensor histidine kinase [Candidatus Binatia bacterium]|jgi:signal transduction histidine kinase